MFNMFLTCSCNFKTLLKFEVLFLILLFQIYRIIIIDFGEEKILLYNFL